MGAIAFYPQSLLSSNKQLKLGKSSLSMREIADWPSAFAVQNNRHNLTIVSIRSDGSRRDRPPQKGFSAGRTKKGDGNKMSQLSDAEVSSSSDQEGIIALFKRIQSSISKGGSVSPRKRNPVSSEVKHTDELVTDVLFNTQKKVKDTTSIKDRKLKRQEIRNNEPVADFKLTRLPSNFVKRSPIPSPSAPRGKAVELNSKAFTRTGKTERLKLPRVEELKLPQLKELAKARGLKGYSRLKKSELVKLLRS